MMTLIVLQEIAKLSLMLSSSLACLDLLIPDMADIVLETIEYNSKISGRVDFVGIQRPLKYYPWPSKIEGERNVLSLFMSKLNTELREKIHITQSYDFQGCVKGCFSPWWMGEYSQFLLGYQEAVNDSLSFGESCLTSGKYNTGNNKMVGIALSQIKKYSNADYFLLIAIKPLEYNINKSKKVTVALLTIIYNRDGKKIYSKIYEETLDVAPSAPTLFTKEFPFYDCTMKLIENQGEQISKDLKFLLTADDAPSPTLEDLHRRLQQPGTIDDDVKFLKEFRKK
ncbi:MAG: hypothetical protein FWG92_00890 [Leptospirales bacterium]|nr:hypothetical protein [Leptospirales bacterium]